jgi:hypothetical protein
MATTVVEIHVPLHEAPSLAETEYQFPWIGLEIPKLRRGAK